MSVTVKKWRKDGQYWDGRPIVSGGMVIVNPTRADFISAGWEEVDVIIPDPEPTTEEKTFDSIVETSMAILVAIKAEVGDKATIAEFLQVARSNGDENATTVSIKAWCDTKGISFSDNMQSLLAMNTDATNNGKTWYDLIDRLAEESTL